MCSAAKMRIRTLTVLLAAAAATALQPAVAWALQLPPEIQANRYLVEAEKEIQEQDFAGAKEAMDRILEMQEQHGLAIPEQFFFRYAKVLERLELYDEAIETVTRYLTLAGRASKHYREALELLGMAETAAAARRRAEAAFAGMEFVRVPAGQFVMGSTSAEASEREQPVRQVRISKGFSWASTR